MAQRRLFGDGTLRWGLEAGDGAAEPPRLHGQHAQPVSRRPGIPKL